MGDLEGALGGASEAVSELGAIFSLFESYGIGEWVEALATGFAGLIWGMGIPDRERLLPFGRALA